MAMATTLKQYPIFHRVDMWQEVTIVSLLVLNAFQTIALVRMVGFNRDSEKYDANRLKAEFVNGHKDGFAHARQFYLRGLEDRKD